MPDDQSAAAPDPSELAEITARLDRLAERERNLAFQQALLDERLLRVEHNRAFTGLNAVVGAGANLLRRAANLLPAQLRKPADDSAAYARWIAHEQAVQPSVEEARAASQGWASRPKLSVLLCAPDQRVVSHVLESLRLQIYDQWELCACNRETSEIQTIGPSGSVSKSTADLLDEPQSLNAAARLATGQYLCIVDGPGSFSSIALYVVADRIRQGECDLLYGDEDLIDAQGRRSHPRFKPGWSPDLLTSCMYLGRPLVIRRDCLVQAGGLSSGYAGAHLYELALRLADQPLRVAHLPRILYHATSRPDLPAEAAARAVADALTRREKAAPQIASGAVPGTFLVRRPHLTGEMTAIICSSSPKLLESCLSSLRTTAGGVVRQVIVVAHEESGPDPELHRVIKRGGAIPVSFRGAFDFAGMNNAAVSLADSADLLFLNDDVRATKSGWAELLAEQVAREEVGVCGSVLWYPTGVLQHAGIVAGIGDGVGHVGRHMRSSALWPWLQVAREVSAVTGACLAIRKGLFLGLGGFDPVFPNNYNDVDLCFRVRSRGYRVVCVPAAGLIHAECQSRPGIVRFEERYRFYERWAGLLRVPDPYYSEALAPTEKIALNLNASDWHRRLLGGNKG